MEPRFSHLLCGFRKNHNTQYFLLKMLEKWKFSTCKNIYKGAPQGSVLGPLLFHIFINDMFYFTENCYLCNYADDNTLYAFDCNMNVVKEKLYKNFEVLDTWFYDNYMALNPGKCNSMCLGSKLSLDEIFVYKIFKLKNTSVNEIVGVNIDRELKFDKHVKHICKKAGNMLSALTRMANVLNPLQKNTLSPNLSSRINSITAHFYGCFDHARQTI